MIPQANPQAGYLARKEAIDAAVLKALESGCYILGPEVEHFEEEFSRYLGVAHAVGTGNGTDALQLALRAAGVGRGDVVATVSHTAVATAAAICQAGAEPLFIDVDERYTMDPSRLEQGLSDFARSPAAARGARVRAVIAVHLYGHPADLPALLQVAERHGAYLIEDCAQAAGAELAGAKAGCFGHLAAFSFYPTKNLGALGDGGAVVTSDAELAARARQLRQYGWHNRLSILAGGINSRLDELQAATLRVRLPWLDADNASRREIAGYYGTHLKGVTLPDSREGCRHVYHQYVIRSSRRDELKRHLEENGVGSAIHYPVPVHLHPAFGAALVAEGGLAVTERVCGEILSLPIYPELSGQSREMVCRAVNLFGER